jgi:hypothetical protein
VSARSIALAAVAVLALVASGCGGSNSSSGSSGGSGGSSSSVTARVSSAKGKIEKGEIVGSIKVKLGGGTPGKHYTLQWGVIDAVSGVRASDEELVAARYTTTSKVESHDVTVEQKVPGGTTAYLVHFVLNGPDGSYVSSADSSVFQADGS